MISIRIASAALLLALAGTAVTAAPVNILYMNSTRGTGTGGFGDFRSAIADSLDAHGGGGVFDVTFVQEHQPGDLAAELAAQAVGFYEQIWFDTTILDTALLTAGDLAALNAWAANDQPEFILDSSFFFRNKNSATASVDAAAVTVNEALALQAAGGGIFIGTDHDRFADTANQILENFGFDGLFTGLFDITPNATFVGDLLIQPEPVNGPSFFANHLQLLSTSDVPIGAHSLNGNGGNRDIEIVEALFSNSPGKVSHVGASFRTGDDQARILPEPATLGLFLLGGAAAGSLSRRRSARALLARIASRT